MTPQEAIEEIKKVTVGCEPWTAFDFSDGELEEVVHVDSAIATILNAVFDGTLIPAEQCFSVREGYSASAFKNVDLEEGVGYSEDVPLTEALEIRSADDVRREGYAEGYKDGFKKSGWEEMQRQTALIDTTQPKGGDDG